MIRHSLSIAIKQVVMWLPLLKQIKKYVMVSFDRNSNNHTAARLAQSAERLIHSSAGDRRSYSRGRTNSPGLKNRDTTFVILETARPSRGSDD